MPSWRKCTVSRDQGLYLQDILAACSKVLILAEGMDLDGFSNDWRVRDAVLHNLEVAGEAVKRLPAELVAAYPEIPWKRIAGFRDVHAHAYFSLDDAIVWDVAANHIEPLQETVRKILEQLDS